MEHERDLRQEWREKIKKHTKFFVTNHLTLTPNYMNENIILILCVVGYIIIAAFIIGLFHRVTTGWDDDLGTIVGVLWPFSIVALITIAIGYLPYKLAVGDFKKKNKMHKIEKLNYTQVDLFQGIGFSTPIEDVIDKLNEVIDAINEITNESKNNQ